MKSSNFKECLENLLLVEPIGRGWLREIHDFSKKKGSRINRERIKIVYIPIRVKLILLIHNNILLQDSRDI